MRTSPFAVLLPVLLSAGVPLAAVGCSSDTTPDTQAGGAGGTTGGAGGTTSGTAGTGTGGSTTGGTGGSTTGGTGGTGGSTTGGTGGSTTGGTGGTGGSVGGAGAGGTATAGMGGKAMAGGGGMGGKGVAGGGGMGAGAGGSAGSGAGGMGGASSGGMGGAMGAGAGGSAGGGAFTLTSPTQADGMKFDGKYTCNGGNLGGGINPELDWAGVPAGTKFFAITFIDTTIGDQSPMGQHWAIWNIPWDGTKVAMFPEGTKTLSGDLMSAKQSGAFLAPCAQSLKNNMDDQYAFTIYALSDMLTVSGTSVANCLTALKAVTPLGKAVLTGHAGLKGQ
jgi:phosphatidylethanolamine-binding protein (PEBP) family uncharacterized protein